MPTTWQAFYAQPLIGTWTLSTAAALFLALLAVRGVASGPGVEPRAAGFVRTWAIVFALDAVLDPIATGVLGWSMLPFVLLGDYRVFALFLLVMQPARSRGGVLLEAAGWTLIVPAIAYGLYRGIAAVQGPQPEAILWLIYELSFVLLTLVLWRRVVPARVEAGRPAVRRYLGAVAGMVIAYYVLWATADVVILSGVDAGWALRIVPNLLYYGAFVPFAYARFFASGPSAATSSSVHAAR